MYGRVDLSIGKNLGAANKFLGNGSGSRLGMRGVEDLGGGMKALFNIEHRFEADTGAQSNAQRFWTGRSIVGLEGGFGQVVLGREYTTAFLQSQLLADPWGWDTITTRQAGAGGVVGLGGNAAITGGLIATVRNDSSLTYKIAAGGVTFGAQIAEASDTFTNVQKKPFNFAVSYAGGPFTAGFGYEKTGAEGVAAAKWTTFNAAYNLGAVKVGGLIGNGNTATNQKHKSWLLTATAPLGAGEFRASYGKLTADPAGAAAEFDVIKQLSLGYHYSLSKRSTIYVDFANNGALNTQKTGYDVGLKHNF